MEYSEIESLLAEQQRIERAGELQWFHWLIIGLSLLLTFGAWYFSKTQVEMQIRSQFDREAERTVALISEKMNKYEDALWSGVAAIHSQSHGIDYKEWKRFSETLRIEKRHPGINGIGVIYNVKPGEKTAFELEQQANRPDYKIYPPHDEKELLPITFIEPLEGNAAAVGLDMAHEINRYTAAQKARSTGLAQITGPITLVQDSERTPGFLFYVPFYQRGEQKTQEEREEQFVGLVYAPFIVQRLMQGALDKENRWVGIQITDGSDILYDEHLSDEIDFDADPLFQKTMTVDMYGRQWDFQIWSTLSFRENTANNKPIMILIGGIIIDLFLLAHFILLAISNKRTIAFARRSAKTHRQSAESLRESEERYELSVKGSAVGLWDWNVKADTLFWSDRFKEMMGLVTEASFFKFEEFSDRLHPEDKNKTLKAVDDHLQKKVPYDVEYRLKRNDGVYIWIHARGQALWDEESNAVRMAGSVDDITDEKEAAVKLEEARIFQDLMINTIPDLVFVKDKDFKIIQANNAFLDLYPKEKRDRIIGFTTIEDYDPEAADAFFENDRIALRDGYHECHEVLRFPDGKIRTLLTTKTRFTNPNGDPFILAVARDITELKEAQSSLENANTELEQFAYIASHDLKSPMRAIDNLAQWIAEDLEEIMTEDTREKITLLRSRITRLEMLLEDILAYSRAGRILDEPEEIDTGVLVREIADSLGLPEGFRVHVPDNMPVVIAAQTPLRQIFLNLINNAYRHHDKEEGAIEVLFEDKGSYYEFGVQDNGPGIPEEFHDRVFQMFQTLQSRDKTEGTGLGMAIIKKMVEWQEGKVWIESPGEDRGTAIKFLWPKEYRKGSV